MFSLFLANTQHQSTGHSYQELKSVPFTFCNMPQNIFDLKKRRKKRGRKRKTISTDEPFTNQDAMETTLAIIKQETFDEIEIETPINPLPCPLHKRPKLENQDFESANEENFNGSSKSIKQDHDTSVLNNNDFEDEIATNSDSSDDLRLAIDDEEDDSDFENESISNLGKS